MSWWYVAQIGSNPEERPARGVVTVQSPDVDLLRALATTAETKHKRGTGDLQILRGCRDS